MVHPDSMRRAILLILLVLPAVAHSQPIPDSGRYDALSATVWFQSSGEFRALCYQAYALASLRLDADLRDSVRTRPRAIIVDVDETVLDNGPHQAKLLQTGTAFPAWWREWIERSSAEAIPGAVEFLTGAAARGVDVFYVTNRTGEEHAATVLNLKKRGFPCADDAHVLTRTQESSKEPRRRSIAASHDIVLLVGDNLADFTQVFERLPVAERNATVDRRRAEFGSRFIVLPNPLYGDWESAAFRYERNLTPARRQELRLKTLRSFE